MADEIRAALASLQPEELDERLVPPQELWGKTDVALEVTRCEVFIMSIRHAALHLGELRLTSDLAPACLKRAAWPTWNRTYRFQVEGRTRILAKIAQKGVKPLQNEAGYISKRED